jgi:hypothetical protein
MAGELVAVRCNPGVEIGEQVDGEQGPEPNQGRSEAVADETQQYRADIALPPSGAQTRTEATIATWREMTSPVVVGDPNTREICAIICGSAIGRDRVRTGANSRDSSRQSSVARGSWLQAPRLLTSDQAVGSRTSAARSITWSMKPYSFASWAVNQRSRSESASILSTGWPV